MYLFGEGRDLGYRTTELETIGTNVSSGCARIINQDARIYMRALHLDTYLRMIAVAKARERSTIIRCCSHSGASPSRRADHLRLCGDISCSISPTSPLTKSLSADSVRSLQIGD